MTNTRKTPYIFLFVLILIIAFIGGLRYGQSVERTNKVVDFILSITPSPTPSLVKPSPVSFRQYTMKGCNISFLYPTSLTLGKSTSDSGQLMDANDPAILFSCAPGATTFSELTGKQASPSAISYKDHNVAATHYNLGSYGMRVFNIPNTINPTKKLLFAVSDSLLPLIVNTIQFSK